METSNSAAMNSDSLTPSSPINGGGTERVVRFPHILRFVQSPISSLLEYSGIYRARPDYSYTEAHSLLPETTTNNSTDFSFGNPRNSESVSNSGEVSIRIIGEHDESNGESDENGVGLGVEESLAGNDDVVVNGNVSGDDDSNSISGNTEASSYQRYDIQRVARWIENFLPFLLLLLLVFIRQHFGGFFSTIYVTVILFKSNEILRKQTALKGERKIPVLVGYFVFFIIHISGVYWCYHKDDILYPLFMIPPKAIPPFWHAVFIILLNDTMARQAAMILKLAILMYYKNGRGHNFRRQGQMLTLVEYTLLLYRALLPTPVWYRFFLNKEYGSLFSSLVTGLYLTFKLTSIVEKVKFFFSALKALSRKEVHYGSRATSEQVNAAGDLCAICQEKMHAPILLRCKHIFCEDCVSEWFERERTCPLCRALVRPADLRSYGDGSTSIYFQLF
ncbi:hypothetical protein ACJIZ3_009463 [Penstemon smallii]|uniref:RING-type domain-containing protein n=1 Tax=Penstemon smallii TaxID=265156 RepID=A0ABD3TEJ1_9LAMI